MVRSNVQISYKHKAKRENKQTRKKKKSTITLASGHSVVREISELIVREEKSYVRGLNYISITSEIGDIYYLYNGHKDVVQLVKEDGQVKSSYDYDIFANQTLTVEEKNEIRYARKYKDKKLSRNHQVFRL